MNDKSELLNQLKIDRTKPSETGGISKPIFAGSVIAALIIGGYGSLKVFAPDVDTIKAEAQAEAAKKLEVLKVASATTEKQADTAEGTEILNASGYITARRIATVSAEIMGLITEVAVEEGMTVKEGQVLAHLDSAVARANLQYAQAQVSAAQSRLGAIEAELAEAKRVLERTTSLEKAEFSTEAALTSAKAQVETLQATYNSTLADINVAKVEVKRQQERLNDHTIRAPFTGVVTVKNAQPGEIVAPTSAGGGFTRTGICTIVDMDSLEIEVDVNEAFIGRVTEDQPVKANLDAYPDWTIPAHVIAIIPTADRAKATVRVRIAIDTKDARILPDMGVKVAFLKA